MGVGAVKHGITTMLLPGFAGLVCLSCLTNNGCCRACSMAIGELVSFYTQYDIQMAPDKKRESNNNEVVDEEAQKEKRPNPFQAALASAMAFSVGTVVPLLAAIFIRNHKIRLAAVAAAVSLALLVFGGVGAVLGKTPVRRSCVRVLIGGWMAMAITFGLTKLIGSAGF